ncbi:Ubp1p [Sugiyamaella lignohabitans]|uniref:Ubiquitin carboxyl-terminal hydrolase n=1 Tax=Sugiyamaella lignohabitans TaxID=796027 RepID=A0A167EEG4_9ASCO|nr:Ubp1p [Sugiyamaella lignohabitans]ANB13972.1 Ubp1p [Sugiyamaella lignohabitans]
MLSDTIKGSMDMASASMKYLYDKAATKVLGPMPFDESELTEAEKANGIEEMRMYNVGGIYNEGNTCFMNSVVQSFASLQYLEEFLDDSLGIPRTQRVLPELKKPVIPESASDGLTENAGETGTSIASTANDNSGLNGSLESADTLNGGSGNYEQGGQSDKVESRAGTLPETQLKLHQPSTNGYFSLPRNESQRPMTPGTAKVSLLKTLLSLMSQLNEKKPSSHTYTTTQLIKSISYVLGKDADVLTGYDQEDAQEFFQQILSCLEKEVKKTPTSNTAWEQRRLRESSVETNASIDNETNGSANSASSNNSSNNNNNEKLLTPFDGVFATRVGCVKCGEMEGIRRGTLSSVDLSLQNGGDDFELEGLLAEYCAMETISGVECYRCSLNAYKTELETRLENQTVGALRNLYATRVEELKSALSDLVIDEAKYAKLKPTKLKELGDKTKQTMFAMPCADIMMIHINRSVFDLNTGYSRKNYAPVRFPVQLDMSPFIVDTNDPVNRDPSKPMAHIASGRRYLYNLKATVIHYGSHNFGHYVCFRKCEQGFWWRISDHSVDLTTEHEVLRTQGVFMLFYERDHE